MGWLNDNAFWLKNRFLRDRSLKEYEIAMSNQWASAVDLRKINWMKRVGLVTHAYENTAFYRQFYKQHSFHPEELKCERDWASIPVVCKKHISEYFDDILDHSVNKSYHITTTTGGSTGLPVTTIRDRRFYEEILQWRMLSRWSSSPADNKLMLWRIPQAHRTWKHKWINTAIWWPTIRMKADVASLNNETLSQISERVMRRKPPIIWGYVGAVEQLADYMDREGKRVDYRPLVWVTAAPVSDLQLSLFQRVFGDRILDQYACSEIHWIGHNLPGERNLVLDFDYRHVDILGQDDQPVDPGVIGNIALTDLQNRVFPLIKYKVGDRSSYVNDEFSAFASFPRITPVLGRITDCITTPSGTKVTGEYLTTIFDDYTDIVRQFQVVQAADFSVSLKVVYRGSPSRTRKAALEDVRKTLVAHTNGEIPVEFEEKSHIPDDMGKIRFVRSEVS